MLLFYLIRVWCIPFTHSAFFIFCVLCLHVLDANSWALIDHHDAVAVTHLQDLLCVRVVAGAERVGSQPLEQVEVLDNQRPIKSFPPNLQHIMRRNRRVNHLVDFRPLPKSWRSNESACLAARVPLQCSCGKVLPPSSGTHVWVLMLVDSMEVERLVVDKKLRAGHVDCADADWKSVHVLIRWPVSGCQQVDLDIQTFTFKERLLHLYF